MTHLKQVSKVFTSTQIPGYGMKNIGSLSLPCSSSQSAAEKNLLNVMKQGKKQTNR